MDRFGLSDLIIPRLRQLACSTHSSRWEAMLHSPEWGMTSVQARLLSRAMLADFAPGQKVGLHYLS